MFNGTLFESIRIVAKRIDGRYRLVYETTGNPFLNLMGGVVDGGGYDSEHEATRQAKRCTSRLQMALQMGGIKPGISNARAVALVL